MSINRSNPISVGVSSTVAANPMQLNSPNVSWAQLSIGRDHIIGIRSDKTMWAWGNNSAGQLGNSSLLPKSSPVQIGSGLSWNSVSAGNKYTLALDSSNTLWGWGDNTNDVLGLGANSNGPMPAGYYLSVAIGFYSSFYIRYDGTLWAYGTNSANGELGDGTTLTRSSPVQIGTDNNWQSIVTGMHGNYYTGAIKKDGTRWAWGYNGFGNLGDGTTVSKSSPVQIGTDTNWTSVVIAAGNAWGIKSDGTLWASGINSSNGTFGDSTTVARSSPVQVAGSWTSVSGGNLGGTLGIKSDGTLWGWGRNDSGQSGDGTTVTKSSPVQVSGGGSWTQIVSLGAASFGVKTDGSLWSWGSNGAASSILGSGSTVALFRSTPGQIGAPQSWVSVQTVNSTFAYATRVEGTLYAWGSGSGVSGYSNPQLVGTDSWTYIGSGGSIGNNPYGKKIDGNWYIWGTNTYRMMLPDTNTATTQTNNPVRFGGSVAFTGVIRQILSPTQISTSSWSVVNAGVSHSAGILSNGTLWTWGKNDYGQLGDSTFTSKSSPTQVAGSYINVSVGLKHTLAVKSDNTLYGWGDNTNTKITVPFVTTTQSWTSISSNNNTVIAVRYDGTLWTWGNNATGQLGTGDTISRSSPTQIGTNTNWSYARSGDTRNYAITTSGALYGMGSATSGLLGDGTTVSKSSPVQIGAGISWSKVYASVSNTVGIATDNNAYIWGDNTYNQLYWTTASAHASVPTQISASARDVAIGNGTVYLIDTSYKLWSWGKNDSGQVGQGTTVTPQTTPQRVGGSTVTTGKSGTQAVRTTSFVSISAGPSSAVAIDSTGALWSWGYNDNTIILGNGTSVSSSSPTQIKGVGGRGNSPGSFTAVTYTGISAVLVRSSSGTLYGWGLTGSSGISWSAIDASLSIARAYNPVSISPGAMSVGEQHAAAILKDGTLYLWGLNSSGQLGNGATTNIVASSAALLPPPSGTKSWKYVLAGNASTFAIDSSSNLWAWGNSLLDTMVNVTALDYRSSPVMIPTLAGSWNSLGGTGTAGTSQYLTGLLNDGTAWGTGYNPQNGVLGPIAANYYWSKVAKGQYNTLFLRNDGLLWSNGYNQYGAVGDGTTISRSSPVQIGSYSWTQIDTIGSNVTGSYYYSIGLRSDGTLWSWGNNLYGQLGDGTTINRSSPVQVGTSSWIAVAGGYNSKTFGIKADGTLWGWGRTELGTGYAFPGPGINYLYYSSPVQIGTENSWNQLFSGAQNTAYLMAALKNDKSLWVWGSNTNNALGIINYNGGSSVVNLNTTQFTQISPGEHTIAIDNSNNVWTWGRNDFAQLGDGSTSARSFPVQINTPVPAYKITGGLSHTLMIGTDRKLYAWGAFALPYNVVINGGTTGQVKDYAALLNTTQAGMSWTVIRASDGKLAYMKDMSNFISPIGVSYTQIAAGVSAMYAIDTQSRLWGWGVGASSQWGDGTTSTYATPTLLDSTLSWKKVAASTLTVNALTTDGTLWAAGTNTSGLLGKGKPSTGVDAYMYPMSAEKYSDISVAQSIAMALRTDGTIWGWGYTNISTGILTSSPVQLASGSYTYISAGSSHQAAIKTDGTLWLWGSNTGGKLGNGNVVNSAASPVQVYGGGSWLQVACWDESGGSSGTTFGLKTDGTLWGWGYNDKYQLGQLVTGYQSSPVQVGAGISWNTDMSYTTVKIAQSSVFILAADKTLYRTGYDIATAQYASSPTIVSSFGTGGSGISTPTLIESSSWNQVAAGTVHYVGVKSDGTLWAWGSNIYGQLGLGDTVTRSSPVQIGTDNSWTFVAISSNFTLALKNDGTIWTWGYNSVGQLAQGDLISRSAPTQIPSSASYISVAASNDGGAAVRYDGTLWTWGNNIQGRLGDGTTISKSSPIQSGALQNWSAVTSGGDTYQALKQDGTLWSWGYSAGYGAIGDAASASRSSPTQIGTSYNPWSILANNDTGNKNKSGFSETNGAITTAGYPYLWGYGGFGGMANNNVVTTNTAPIIPTIFSNTIWAYKPWKVDSQSWTQVSIGVDHAHAIPYGSTSLYSWGSNVYGQLGEGLTTNRTTWTGVYGSWAQVRANNSFSVGIKSDGTLWAWGAGNSTTWNTLASMYVPLTGSYRQIGGGYNFFLGIRDDYTLWTYGTNAYGQLGMGDTVDRSSPVQVSSSSSMSWNLVANTQSSSFASAITTDYRLYTWGAGVGGYLGNNSVANQSFITQIPGSWIAVSVGAGIKYVTATYGTLWMWGQAQQGVLGNGVTTGDRSSPVQLGTGNWTYISVSGSYGTVVGVSSTVGAGALYTWGYNGYGQLGAGTTTSRSSPVQVGALTTWTSPIVGYGSNLMGGLVSGSLYMWGYWQGIGDGTTNYRSSPVSIGSYSKFYIPAGFPGTFGINASGSLYGWGSSGGSGGWNTTAAVSAPTVINNTLSWNLLGGTGAGPGTYFAQTTSGTLYAWGATTNGLLGPVAAGGIYSGVVSSPVAITSIPKPGQSSPVFVNTSSPVQIGGLPSWRSLPVTASLSGSYAMLYDGTLYGWGPSSTTGEFGDGTTVAHSSPTQIGNVTLNYIPAFVKLNNTVWSSLASYYTNSLAIKAADSSLWAWGYNFYGQLGDGTTINKQASAPVQIMAGYSFTMVVTTLNNSAAIRSDGTLWIWGRNDGGQLGDGTTISKSSPIQVGSGTSWVHVALQYNAATATTALYAADSTGAMFACGYAGAYGQLGDGSTVSKSSLVQIGSNYSRVYAFTNSNTTNVNTIYAINSADQTLYAWGYNSSALTYDGTVTVRSSPVAVGFFGTLNSNGVAWPAPITNLTGSYDSIVSSQVAAPLIATSNGLVYEWGATTSGSLGINGLATQTVTSPILLGNVPVTSTASPILISNTTSWVQASAGYNHSMAIDSTNKLWGWGSYAGSALISYSNGNGGFFKSVSSDNGNTFYAIGFDGSLWSWGSNLFGALGNGTTVSNYTPQNIGGTNSWILVCGSAQGAFAIRNDNTLWAWGLNTSGVLGLGDVAHRSSPVQVGTDSWIFITASSTTAFAIRTDYTLWGWGTSGVYGVLGKSDTVNRSAPVQISTSSWIQVSVYSGNNAAAIRVDGTLWTWGYNIAGQLGDGSTVSKSSPVQVGALTTWKKVSVGISATVALKTDGTLWGWGDGTTNYVRGGSGSNQSSPVQIPAASGKSWVDLPSKAGTGIAAKQSDGTIWGWGSQSAGQLGLGDTAIRSTPTKLSSLFKNAIDFSITLNNTGYYLTNNNELYITGTTSAVGTVPGLATSLSSPVQLGLYIGPSLSTPTQIGNNSWINVGAGNDINFATDSLKTLYFWGKNNQHQSGIPGNYYGVISSPAQVGTNIISSLTPGLPGSNDINIDGITSVGQGGFIKR